MKLVKKEYRILEKLPVAYFYYQGKSHTHPVRRIVLLIDSRPGFIRGYELKEGNTRRRFRDAPVKSYTRSKIAKIKDVDLRRSIRRNALNLEDTTLRRKTLLYLIKKGY